MTEIRIGIIFSIVRNKKPKKNMKLTHSEIIQATLAIANLGWNKTHVYETFDLLMGFSTLGERLDVWAAIVRLQPRLA